MGTGCTSVEAAGDKGYVTGSGAVMQLPPADRDAPVALVGEDLDGNALDLATYRGKPTVVVVWGSWCTPCRVEAPEVKAASMELDGTAEFVGIDVRDASLDNARAYERTFGVEWPSFNAADGTPLLAFEGTLTPYTVPAFVVLDDEGRVAASIIGALPSKLTLVELVEEIAAETDDG